ncbi:MAG TPA: DUF1800 domain-containing protein [Vicinamibacterales bacterium]|nr:DUF1800 domain-containing protein [Vicinamibacterales bacterium]
MSKLCCIAVFGLLLAGGMTAGRAELAPTTINNDARTATHVLNRVAFGARPGGVERVRAIGIDRYIDEQLHPERIPDTSMAPRLAGLSSLTMSSREISEKYEQPLLQARRERAANGRQNGQPQNGQANGDLPPPMQDPVQQRAQSVVLELSEQKLLRAIYSDRQLQEVLADFWFNHFNVDARKGQDRFMLTEYERDTIRPHVLGKFRDLLEATAKSPAMLFYLDNWMSADPAGPHPGGNAARGGFGRGRFGAMPPRMPPPRTGTEVGGNLKQPPSAGRRGLNENYGRELMELHTLGVDGGYTQKDVTEVARALTGWTIRNPRQGGGFQFEPRLHDEGQKVVLGHVIKAGGGQSDGEQVLDILARHPSTAKFISTKLVRRFVSDTPPQALVDRAAKRFADTGGDIREVMRTILTSPEFFAPDAYRAKVKTPFEFVVSAVRSTGADVDDAMPLVRAVNQLGMPLYQCQPPTGYKDTADAWVNTGALVNRMNVALQITSGQMRRAIRRVDLPPDGDAMIARLLGGDASDTTRGTIAKAATPPQMAALTLGSPEFQRR